MNFPNYLGGREAIGFNFFESDGMSTSESGVVESSASTVSGSGDKRDADSSELTAGGFNVEDGSLPS